MTETLARALEEVLLPVLGEVRVENLQPLTGGASRLTWAFDAVGDTRRALILRTGAGDDINTGMELEALAQQRAATTGTPVPHILTADNSLAALGNPFLICDAVAGESIARRILRGLGDAGRSRLLQQCAAALAAIHRADPAGIGLTSPDELADWRARLGEVDDTTATFEWAFRRLAERRPAPSPQRLVHGDFRMGNLIVDDAGLAAVLDWELTHIGEVYEDLAWFCIRAWRFGAPETLGAGGLGSVEAFLRAYEQEATSVVDRDAFRWWQTMATLRWGVICRNQAERHLSGATRSVELIAIGRRVSETEWDLLDLLSGAEGREQRLRDARKAPTGNPLSRRPTAAELVAAVADFLDNDVRAASTGQVDFHARVAANVLRIVERELLDETDGAVLGALQGLGFTDEASLARAIRAGELDDRGGDVMACLRILVYQKLSIDHPGYGPG